MLGIVFVVLSRDPLVRGEVVNAGAAAGELYLVARDADDLIETITATRPRAVVLDLDYGDGEAMLARVNTLRSRGEFLVVLVVRDITRDPPHGAHVVVFDTAVRHALPLVDKPVPRDDRRPIALDRLLSLSVLSGPLDQALAEAAEQVARGFNVDRCVISVHGDATGGAASGARTLDSLTWSQTSEHCRAAAGSGATIIAMTANTCESYLAVPLATPLGSHGFLGLVTSRPRVYPREDRIALEAVASRIGAEIGWRGVHQRTADEMERLANGPGLDPLLGVWNRTAMTQLATMFVSGARRAAIPMAVVAIDIVDMHTLNTRYGLDAGDQLLRRAVDAIRSTLRTEDIVGRWSGDKLAVLLHGTSIDGAERVAERFQAAFAARPVEIGEHAIPIPAAIGVAGLDANEDAAGVVARALWSAKKAETSGVAIARAATGPMPRLSQQMEVVGDDLRTTLGGAYRLLHEISRGGMGVVYRAEDLALERPVAIKMLRPDLAEDKAFVEQLRNEAAMLARYQHPNLVQIYNFGQTGGDSYFVMELVEGESMQQAVDRHRVEGTVMPVGELVPVIEQVASALDALHERGIIHRDVKPSNVIRDPFRSRSVLVDVGIARRFGVHAESAGTPGYVAPEIIAGKEGGPRSDVYGLAATAYTMLALSAPWGDGEGVLARQLGETPIAPPSKFRPELAPADELFGRALHRHPQHRPETAGAFARSLAALVSPLASTPTSAAGFDSTRWIGRTIMPSRAVARSRGVVFRSVARALNTRDADKLRDSLGGDDPELARAIAETAPLAWLPTDLLARLLTLAPKHVDRDAARFARDLGRATVRVSFRRFFPASSATLVPERTLSAIRNVWGRYHTWGAVACLPVRATETVVRMTETRRDAELCAWTMGMLEQLVVLSGGRNTRVEHEACEANREDACLFRVTWDV